jgi:hypothetical protein
VGPCEKQAIRNVGDGARRAVYRLVLHPQRFWVDHLSVVAKGNEAIAEQHLLTDNALMVSFKGQQQPVRWDVSFRVSPKE